MSRTADEDVIVSPAAIDEWQRAGLYDPEAPGADQRMELLEYLHGLGATTEQMVDADQGGELVSLSAELLYHSDARLSVRELAELYGTDNVDGLVDSLRAAGLTIVDLDEPMFRPRDASALQVMADAYPIFGVEAMKQFVRVVGASMAAIADAAMASFGSAVASRLQAEGASELQVAKTIEVACDLLFNRGPAGFETIFYHHGRAAMRRAAATGITRNRTANLAVAFVDLVGSTGLAQQLDPAQFGEVISAFEQRAVELSAAHGGRVVKTIGDEVMIVTTDASSACGIALELCQYADEHALLPPMRGAVAFGELTPSVGDYYGVPVNLAARMVKMADPRDVLVTAGTAAQLRTEASSQGAMSIGRHSLRGFEEPVELFRLEPSV
jgi:class 3 adenylate cyclase